MEQITITAAILILHELNVFFQLKKLLGYTAHVYKKPFDCFFCLSVWANLIGFVTIYLLTGSTNINDLGYQIIISKIIDLLWNKN